MIENLDSEKLMNYGAFSVMAVCFVMMVKFLISLIKADIKGMRKEHTKIIEVLTEMAIALKSENHKRKGG